MPSNHLILCRPLPLLPSIFPSIRVFSNESALRIRWPKYWSFSFNTSPSNEHPGLISFRMDWLHLLAFQGTLKSLLQHHSSKASILLHSAFFIVQLSHPYMTTGKTIALTRWTFVDKVLSLLLNMLSRLVITFLKTDTRGQPTIRIRDFHYFNSTLWANVWLLTTWTHYPVTWKESPRLTVSPLSPFSWKDESVKQFENALLWEYQFFKICLCHQQKCDGYPQSRLSERQLQYSASREL